MGLMDWFKKTDKNKDEFDPLRDLVLSRLKVGFMLDYDLKTWQVTASNRYEDGSGTFRDEWELTHGREKIYLESQEDDDVEWSISRKIPIGMIGKPVTDHIIKHEDPPDMIIVREEAWYLDSSSPLKFFANGRGPGQPLIEWVFVDASQQKFITIEQWDEENFEAAEGQLVEEFEFTNILPGEI